MRFLEFFLIIGLENMEVFSPSPLPHLFTARPGYMYTILMGEGVYPINLFLFLSGLIFVFWNFLL